MKFYRALEGTDLFDQYGEKLIYGDQVAFSLSNQDRAQVRDARPEELAEAFNSSDEFEPDIFAALMELAQVEVSEEEIEEDRDTIMEKVGDVLGVELY